MSKDKHRINEFFEMDELSVNKDSYIAENTAMEADSDVIVDFNNVTFAYDPTTGYITACGITEEGNINNGNSSSNSIVEVNALN